MHNHQALHGKLKANVKALQTLKEQMSQLAGDIMETELIKNEQEALKRILDASLN